MASSPCQVLVSLFGSSIPLDTYYYSIEFCIIIRSIIQEHNKNSSISKTAKERDKVKKRQKSQELPKNHLVPIGAIYRKYPKTGQNLTFLPFFALTL